MKFDIITIGSATRDVFLSTPEFKTLPDATTRTGQDLCMPLGAKIEVANIVFAVGGSGPDSAVTFARQGFKTACLGVIGSDVTASFIIETLATEGIDTSYFQRHSEGLTAYSVILVQPGGERTIISYKGEGQYFDVKKIPFDQLETSWLMLGSLGGHIDLFEEAIKWGITHNVKIACNPGTKELSLGPETLKVFLKECAVVSMNQEEASKLLGIDFVKEEEIFKAMDEIIDGIFVMTKGPAGVSVSDGKNIYHAGVPDSPVVERTGAGDAFISGFVAEYARSGDITKSIQLGTANGSSVVAQFGAQAGILGKGGTGNWPLVNVEVKSVV